MTTTPTIPKHAYTKLHAYLAEKAAPVSMVFIRASGTCFPENGDPEWLALAWRRIDASGALQSGHHAVKPAHDFDPAVLALARITEDQLAQGLSKEAALQQLTAVVTPTPQPGATTEVWSFNLPADLAIIDKECERTGFPNPLRGNKNVALRDLRSIWIAKNLGDPRGKLTDVAQRMGATIKEPEKSPSAEIAVREMAAVLEMIAREKGAGWINHPAAKYPSSSFGDHLLIRPEDGAVISVETAVSKMLAEPGGWPGNVFSFARKIPHVMPKSVGEAIRKLVAEGKAQLSTFVTEGRQSFLAQHGEELSRINAAEGGKAAIARAEALGATSVTLLDILLMEDQRARQLQSSCDISM